MRLVIPTVHQSAFSYVCSKKRLSSRPCYGVYVWQSPSPRRRYFPLPGEKDAGDDKESNYEQQLREYLDE